ncbi:trypsin-like [Phlebotomus papatasi]|uniref:trypsin-like n=1 Tax=Phlebotomus papatasi TaxID=29031 RepID=UPI0024836F27|nr:trypsin-like [Phlebotomus papatasi]
MSKLRILLLGLFIASSVQENIYPHKVTVNTNSHTTCSGTVISPDSLLVLIDCIDITNHDMNVKIRRHGLNMTDSGDIYTIKRIILDPNYNDEFTQDNGYAILKLDRKIESEGARFDANAQKVAKGTSCSTLSIIHEDNPRLSTYWTDMKYVTLKVMDMSECKDLFVYGQNSNNYICVQEENAEDCQGELAAPLVCNGVVVGISTCDVGCFGHKVCAYRKIASIGNFVFQ